MKRTFKTLAVGLFVATGLFLLAGESHAASHVVQPGEWLSTIAPRYGVSWQSLCSHNALPSCDRIDIGQVLQVPPAGHIAPSRPSPAPQTAVRASGGPNGYGYGWCTWWVKEKRPDIGGYWGNAGYNWLTAAQSAGFRTGYTPAPGAIGVMTGHVVYVESVSGNMVNISEMGFNYTPGIVTYRTVPASSFVYIY